MRSLLLTIPLQTLLNIATTNASGGLIAVIRPPLDTGIVYFSNMSIDGYVKYVEKGILLTTLTNYNNTVNKEPL